MKEETPKSEWGVQRVLSPFASEVFFSTIPLLLLFLSYYYSLCVCESILMYSFVKTQKIERKMLHFLCLIRRVMGQKGLVEINKIGFLFDMGNSRFTFVLLTNGCFFLKKKKKNLYNVVSFVVKMNFYFYS